MKANMGGVDRIIRLLLGIVIAVLGVLYQSWLGLIAIIPLGTALIKRCPLYMPFGISTCKTETED